MKNKKNIITGLMGVTIVLLLVVLGLSYNKTASNTKETNNSVPSSNTVSENLPAKRVEKEQLDATNETPMVLNKFLISADIEKNPEDFVETNFVNDNEEEKMYTVYFDNSELIKKNNIEEYDGLLKYTIIVNGEEYKGVIYDITNERNVSLYTFKLGPKETANIKFALYYNQRLIDNGQVTIEQMNNNSVSYNLFVEEAYINTDEYTTDDPVPVSLGIDTDGKDDENLIDILLQIVDGTVISGNEITKSQWQYTLNGGEKRLIDNSTYDNDTRRFYFNLDKSELQEGDNTILVYFSNDDCNFKDEAIGAVTFEYSTENGVFMSQCPTEGGCDIPTQETEEMI